MYHIVMSNKLEQLWEAVKSPMRQIVFALYGFVINWLFIAVATKFGLELSADLKVQILGYATPFSWAVISALDKYLHNLGKNIKEQTGEENTLIKGISRF